MVWLSECGTLTAGSSASVWSIRNHQMDETLAPNRAARRPIILDREDHAIEQ